jgi:ABC-2 type transport system permease protein
VKPVTDAQAVSTQDVLSFDQLLRHTRLSLHPFLPSAWVAKSMLAWGEGLATQELILFSGAVEQRAFQDCSSAPKWPGGFFIAAGLSRSARERALSAGSGGEKRRERRRSRFERGLARCLPLSSGTTALVLKDLRLFWRDPTQWIQFMIFFGLLCIYVLNLRNVAFNFASEFWETMISYLNLAASSLTLSTLTTRFVFPQFSLEGRRIWILGLARSGWSVLWQKFWLSSRGSDNHRVADGRFERDLHLPWERVTFLRSRSR